MRLLRKTLLLSAAVPLAASFVILDVAGVSERVWLTHLVVLGCAGLIVGVGPLLGHGLPTAVSSRLESTSCDKASS